VCLDTSKGKGNTNLTKEKIMAFKGKKERGREREEKSTLTLSLARNVKNLGNSLCIKEEGKCVSPSQIWISGDKHIG
jgi:hypothetical protein